MADLTPGSTSGSNVPFRYLRIKRNTLAYEARIIRKAELQARQYPVSNGAGKEPSMDAFWSLRNHRLDVVRAEARSAHLAHGFVIVEMVPLGGFDPPSPALQAGACTNSATRAQMAEEGGIEATHLAVPPE